MARTWWSIRVELVDGMHAPALWPRPGRVFAARPGMSFRMLADAIDDAFARWDRSHLHAFTLADGTRISAKTPWDDIDEDDLDDTAETLARLSPGEQFVYEFDFGDGWMHLCTVAEEKIDPLQELGISPDRPLPYFGWGAIPDQYGRRWDDDDGSSPLPPAPDPPLSDLPDLVPEWGGDGWGAALSVPPRTGGDVVELRPRGGNLPWSYDDIQDLRRAIGGRDHPALAGLLEDHDALAVAHLAAPALLDAVLAGHARAGLMIERLLPDLQVRGWLGDDELVAEIERVTEGAPGRLRPCPVHLDELSFHLEGREDEGGARLDPATGELWSADPWSDLDAEDDDDAVLARADWLTIVPLGSRVGYGDMRDFIATVEDDRLADRLDVAIQGPGAFRRFKDTLHPVEHSWGAWLTFSTERRLGRARWWLAEEGLRPTTAAD